MASNHTKNYNLNQWVATDKVERVDFNADNAAVETALTTHAERLTQNEETAKVLRSDLEQLELSTALSSYHLKTQLEAHPTFAVGLLEGYDGSKAMTVELGRQAKMVMVGGRLGWNNVIYSSDAYSYCAHAVALPGAPGYLSSTLSDYGDAPVLTVGETGFTLEAGMEPNLAPYYYLALM